MFQKFLTWIRRLFGRPPSGKPKVDERSQPKDIYPLW